MLQIAICEDTQTHAQEISAAVERESADRRAEIECFSTGEELLRYIQAGGYLPDIAILNTRLRDGDGILLAEELNERLPACRIIFVADSLSDATEVYRAEHVWFLLRSELEVRIGPALTKALAPKRTGGGQGLLLRSRGTAIFLPLESILYLERDRRKTLVITAEGEFSASECPGKLLSNGLAEFFVRSHRSYWVNREKIRALDRDEFILSDGRRVPISRSWRAAARAAFLQSVQP